MVKKATRGKGRKNLKRVTHMFWCPKCSGYRGHVYEYPNSLQGKPSPKETCLTCGDRHATISDMRVEGKEIVEDKDMVVVHKLRIHEGRDYFDD